MTPALRIRPERQLNVTVCVWPASFVDVFDTGWRAAIAITSAARQIQGVRMVRLPRISS